MQARNPDKFSKALQCRSQHMSRNESILTIEAASAGFCGHMLLYPQQKICTPTRRYCHDPHADVKPAFRSVR